MSKNVLVVYACDEYPFGNPLPPYNVCQVLYEDGNIDTNVEPGTSVYTNDFSSVTEINGNYVLAYYNTSSYTNELASAVALWDNLGIVDLQEMSSGYNLLFTEGDYGANGVIAEYENQNGVDIILINTYYFNNLTTAEKTRVFAHEIGHALGLDDVYDTSSSSMMAQGISDVIFINSQDIALLVDLFPEEQTSI